MIVVDTSALIGALAGAQPEKPALLEIVRLRERLLLPTLVLYEFWRGPRTQTELSRHEALVPARTAEAFGSDQARVAARLYAMLDRSREREVDIAIAAHALAAGATLWTLNHRDFADVPDLKLHGQ